MKVRVKVEVRVRGEVRVRVEPEAVYTAVRPVTLPVKGLNPVVRLSYAVQVFPMRYRMRRPTTSSRRIMAWVC